MDSGGNNIKELSDLMINEHTKIKKPKPKPKPRLKKYLKRHEYLLEIMPLKEEIHDMYHTLPPNTCHLNCRLNCRQR